MILEKTIKLRVDTEKEAKEAIEQYNDDAKQNGYFVKKASYEYKSKKSKGEIIAEAYVVTLALIFHELWEDVE